MDDLRTYAKQIIDLQSLLLLHLARVEGEYLNANARSGYGVIRVPDTIWGYSFHGSGVRFINVRTLACVDVESGMDRPHEFTVWRLGTYLRSIGESDLAERLEADGPAQLSSFAVEPISGSGRYALMPAH